MAKLIKTLVCLLITMANIQAQTFPFKPFHTIEGYKGFILDTRLSAKNTYLAVATNQNRVELRDQSFEKIWSYQNNPANYGMDLCFAPNEKHLVFSKYQSFRDAGVLDIAQKKIIQKLKTGGAAIVQYSPDGKFLITAGKARQSSTGIIKVWQWKGNQFELLQSFPYQHKRFQNFRSIAFSPNGQYFALLGTMANVLVYKRHKKKFSFFQLIAQRSWTRGVAFHPDGKYLAFGTRTKLYSLRLDKRKQFVYNDSIRVYGGEIRDLRFTPKGKHLLACNKQIRVYAWKNGKFEHGEEEDTYDLHGSNVFALDANKDLIVSGGKDKRLIIATSGKVPAKQVTKNNTQGKKGDTKKVAKTKFESDDLDFDVGASGKNYLLVVGINKYQSWKPLVNATTDARKVAKILQKRYGFTKANTIEVYDEQATNKNILKQLSSLREKLTSQDNLLLYYSGHGYYNAAIKEGFWIPFNAQKGEETQYLANSTLLKYIKAIKAKHIFLVADACFSGSLFTQGKRGYIENVEKYRSRWGFASGRLELVSDGTIGESSPFATYFLKYLSQNQKKRFPISELIQYVKVAVSNNASQTPIGHPLKNVGDEGGEFVFYLKK
ncbi:caspase family protein [uncultured Microscilla sp.]|uniref:caspase family protein n=1 Tax=uncultured Microscilla sp. TaxID=432653 RepID=UPI00260B4582|nr:caspase family protein [uncultured Microscilla sp.]